MWCDINSNYISGVLNRRYTLTTCVNPYSLKLFLWNGNWINNISSHKKIGVIRFVIIEINLCTMKLNQNSMWIMMKIQEKNILITTSNKFQKNRIENIWNWLTEMTIGSILTSHWYDMLFISVIIEKRLCTMKLCKRILWTMCRLISAETTFQE